MVEPLLRTTTRTSGHDGSSGASLASTRAAPGLVSCSAAWTPVVSSEGALTDELRDIEHFERAVTNDLGNFQSHHLRAFALIHPTESQGEGHAKPPHLGLAGGPLRHVLDREQARRLRQPGLTPPVTTPTTPPSRTR